MFVSPSLKAGAPEGNKSDFYRRETKNYPVSSLLVNLSVAWGEGGTVILLVILSTV